MVINSIQDFENLFDIDRIILDVCTEGGKSRFNITYFKIMFLASQGYHGYEIANELNLKYSDYMNMRVLIKKRIIAHYKREHWKTIPHYKG